MITSIERNDREAWAEEHFPMPTSESSDVGLELFLRDRCVKGSGYFDKAATATNWQLSLIKSRTEDLYTEYFLRGAKLEKLESQQTTLESFVSEVVTVIQTSINTAQF